MHKLILDLSLVFLFLAFLGFMLMQKGRYFQYHLQSWRALMLGGILLVLTGGTNLVLNQGGDVFYRGNQQIILAVGVFGYASGGALILFGLLKWCHSLLEVKERSTQRLRQLACMKSILSVVNHGGELDQILKESLPALMNIMGYKMGVIFKRTFNSSKMALVAHQGIPAEKLFACFDLYLKNMQYEEACKSREVNTTADVNSLPEYGSLFSDEENINSFTCVPIKFCGGVLGLMGLYDSNPRRFSYQEIQFLTSVGETLGLAIKQSLVSDRNKKRRNYISAVENSLKIAQENDSLEEAFPRISRELERIIDFDHISLAMVAGPGENMKRISIGTSGGILVDSRAGVPTEGSALGKVIRKGELWIDRNIDLEQSSYEDSLFKACGIKSRIILPLWFGETVCGALSLGHKKTDFYLPDDDKWLKLFVAELSHLVQEQKFKDKLERRENLNRSLNEFDRKLFNEDDIKTLLEDATTSLASDLPKSFARVTLLSNEKKQLVNCAIHQIRSEGIDLKKEERFSLDDLPWHRLALEAKRPMLINQDDPESVMTKKEAGLIMDEKVSSALLVPLILSDKAIGVVSVGEMRNWNRQPLTEEEKAFVEHRANQLSLALRNAVLRQTNERLKGRIRHSGKSKETAGSRTKERLRFSELSYQINNPLTTIRGSVELMRVRERGLSPDGLRYLRNIDNGVDRIHESLEEFLNSAFQKKESKESQPVGQLVSV